MKTQANKKETTKQTAARITNQHRHHQANLACLASAEEAGITLKNADRKDAARG